MAMMNQWVVLAMAAMLVAVVSAREGPLSMDYQLAYKLVRHSTVNGTTTEWDAYVGLMNNTIEESPNRCSKAYTAWWGSSDHFPYYGTSDSEKKARFITADPVGPHGVGDDVVGCSESTVSKDTHSSYYSCSGSESSRQLCTSREISRKYSQAYFGALLHLADCMWDDRYMPCTQITVPAGRMAGEDLRMRNFTLVKRECPPEVVIGVKLVGGEVQGCNHTINGSMVFAPAIGAVVSFQYEEIWSVAATNGGDRIHFFMNTTVGQRGQFKKSVPEDVCVKPTCEDLDAERMHSHFMVFSEEEIDDGVKSGEWNASSEVVKHAYTEALEEVLLSPAIAREVLLGEH